jgi:hypothetical protein
LGEIASAGIPAELPEGHVALAIHVDLASGVAGLLRPGQTVTVIGMISPDILEASTTSVFTAPIAEFTSPIVSLTPGLLVFLELPFKSIAFAWQFVFV